VGQEAKTYLKHGPLPSASVAAVGWLTPRFGPFYYPVVVNNQSSLATSDGESGNDAAEKNGSRLAAALLAGSRKLDGSGAANVLGVVSMWCGNRCRDARSKCHPTI
jgi:hypothetical protein